MIPEFPKFTDTIVTELVAAGRYWWLRDGEYVATGQREPAQPDDVYIGETSPEWLASFASHQEFADLMNQVIAENVARHSEEP